MFDEIYYDLREIHLSGNKQRLNSFFFKHCMPELRSEGFRIYNVNKLLA